MRVHFVDNFPINFGLSAVATVLRKGGHEVGLSTYLLSKLKNPLMYSKPEDYFSFDSISNEMLDAKPDIIAFSVFSINFIFYKRLAEAIRKKSKIPILVGGVLPTLKPDLFMEHSLCDYVFRGEADCLILDLVEKIRLGTFHDVPNLAYRGEGGEIVYNEKQTLGTSLDALPFFDKNFYPYDSSSLWMITSRGCVLNCAFCSAGKYSRENVEEGDSIIRKRSVDSIIAEIKQAQEEKTYKDVYFYDDFFITDSDWLTEFSEKYKKEINLPFTCVAFPATITQKVANLLAKAGCVAVSMGFQTANNDYKKNVLKRVETKETVSKAVKILEEYGIMPSLDHIFNFPGETEEHIKESLDFYISIKVKSLGIFFLNYFPDSNLAVYAYEKGFITQTQYDKILKCEMIGEQSYKGTIIDPEYSELTVKYAILFRLIYFLPGDWVKWLFNNRVYLFFPTNRFLYYFISAASIFSGRGIRRSIYYFSHVLFVMLNFKDKKDFIKPQITSTDSDPAVTSLLHNR